MIMKKILTIKMAAIVAGCVGVVVTIIAIISAITGVSMGYESTIRQASEVRGSNTIVNNQIYASRYKNILNKHLIDKGYVSLERIIFYLQRKHNILDITTLSNDEWEQAYIANLNSDQKRMIPIKSVCKTLNKDTTLSEFTVESGLNDNG